MACRKLHPATPENTYTQPNGRRHCRECRRVTDRSEGRRSRKFLYNRGRRSLEVSRKRESRHSKAYAFRYPEKTTAKRLLMAAIERGDVLRPDRCGRCQEFPRPRSDGRSGIHGHHFMGYDHPLRVMWLCVLCHSTEHRARASAGGGEA